MNLINSIAMMSIFFATGGVLMADDKVWFTPRPIEVLDIPPIISQKELECLAKNIYFEAGHEPEEGMIAVAQVTKNRVQNPQFPKSYCDVVWQTNINKKTGKRIAQFSWTLDGKSDVPRDKDAYEISQIIAQEVLLNRIDSDIIGKNVYNYHAVYVTPKWSRYMKRVAKIGNHLFYRDDK